MEMEGRARSLGRFDASGPSPDVVISHEVRLKADAHSLPLLQGNRLRPRKKEGAVDGFGCTRSIGKTYAFSEIGIEPHDDPVSRPGALDDPIQIAANIGVFDGAIVQRGPQSVARQELIRTHADLLSVVAGKRA